MAPQVFLMSDNLALRPLNQRDSADLAAFLADGRVARTLRTVPHPYELHDALNFIEKLEAPEIQGCSGPLAIDVEGRAVGVIDLQESHQGPTLGMWLAEAYWGRGLMSEAAGALLHVHFDHRGLEKVCSEVLSQNTASLRIHQKLGFRKVGTHEEAVPNGEGRLVTVHDLVLIKEEFGFDADWHGVRYLWG